MRKIDRDMLAAIKAGKYWRAGRVYTYPLRGAVLLFSDNNVIAEIKDGVVKPIPSILRDYPSEYSANRLKALGIDAEAENGTVYIDGVSVEHLENPETV